MNRKMPTLRRVAPAIAAAALLALTGCFSLGRTEPPTRHYVLGGGEVQQSGALPEALSGLAIGVRRIRLASYLDPPFLAVREHGHEITFSEFERWGEPLGAGINRATIEHLGRRGAFRAIDVAPWPARESYDYVIQLHVERFEGVAPEEGPSAGGSVHMLISWELLRQTEGGVLARGTTEYRDPRWEVGDYDALVRSLDAGLIVLATDLASALEQLAAGGATPPPIESGQTTSSLELPLR